MKKLVGVMNLKTGESIDAPSHCPFCGAVLGDLIRHVLGATFEVTCEQDACRRTCIVMNDHVEF